jgi:predicted DNA binding protein
VIAARFAVRLSEDVWISEVSRSVPDATYRLLSGLRTGDSAVELGEVVADDPATASAAVAAHGAISDYEEVERSEGRALAKYENADVSLYEFVEESSLPPEFPLVVEDGWFEFDLTGTRREFEGLRNALEASEREYELLSLVGDSENERLLTDRQRRAVRTAVREGYFEVPRDCTLADLAETLDVDKSTASRVLRRATARVTTWYVTSDDQANHPTDR